MRTNAKHLLTALMIGGALTACVKDKDPRPGGGGPPNEEELITTVELHFEGPGGEHKHFAWRDLDGPGGGPAVVTADTLTAGATYEARIKLYNESVSPADDITLEIENEADEHQFFFQVTGASVTIAYDPSDVDTNGNPVGLRTTWTVGTAGAGGVTITLRHEPDKSAPGVSIGDITNAGGDTDAQVTFPLVVR